jgi:hypothetical protein
LAQIAETGADRFDLAIGLCGSGRMPPIWSSWRGFDPDDEA